jgi:integrase
MIPVQRLAPLHIQAYYTKARESGRKNGSGGLSERTLLHHHRLLREALARARAARVVAVSPFDDREAIEAPRPADYEIHPLSLDEQRRLIEAARGSRFYAPVVVMLGTGLRRGELLALRHEDLDLEVGNLQVRRATEYVGKELRYKAPKSRASRRIVTLPPSVVVLLRAHILEQKKRRLMLGPDYQDNGLLICNEDGTPWLPPTFSSSFRVVVRRSGLQGVRVHDLRHTHASQLLHDGVPVKAVSERLGHSSIAITLQIYAHSMPGIQEQAATVADRALQAALTGEHDSDVSNPLAKR